MILFIFSVRWLNNFIAPFWNTVKLDTGGCKFLFDLVVMLWISWLVVYKSLFFTTNNNNTENIYWDCKGKISSLVNNCLQKCLLVGFVMTRIIRF